MSLADTFFLYRARMGSLTALAQDAFAIVGIAAGVALLFASQVASTSLSHSVSQLTREVVGGAQYQIAARGPDGVSETVLDEVRHLHGVTAAMPVIEEPATLIGPGGREAAVELIGTDPRFAHIGGPPLRHFSVALLARQRAVAVPAPIASSIDVGVLQSVQLQLGATVVTTLLGTTLGEGDIGDLVNSPVVIAPIRYAQMLAGMRGRVSRIFVEASPSHKSAVGHELDRLAAVASVTVGPAATEAQLFAVASQPENESEGLFSVISAIVGFMFALNAMLITIPRRRSLLSHIALQGASLQMTFQILIIDAAILGLLGCLIGVAVGDLLSVLAFRATPGYLTFAFPVGTERVIEPRAVAAAVLAGVLAAYAGVLGPLRNFYLAHRPCWRGLTNGVSLGGALIGAAMTTVILLARPQDSEIGGLVLAAALLWLMPALFDGLLVGFAHVQRRLRRASLRIALNNLQMPAARIRSTAVIATTAVAVFGIVAIQGAQQNLERGLDGSAQAIDRTADVWVTVRGTNNAFATTPFSGLALLRSLSRLPGVASVTPYRGSFLTWGRRRLWILAPPRSARSPFAAQEIVEGSVFAAAERFRQGGWAIISQALAAEHGLRVGDSFTLPSPAPIRLRVAALSTNLGWPPGAIMLPSLEYARAWRDPRASALEINSRADIAPDRIRDEVMRAVGSDTGLVAETASERERRHYTLAAQGLSRLTQIRTLVLLAAMLAIVGALGSLVWLRRDFVAFARCQGVSRSVLWRGIAWESGLLVAAACISGAAVGIYGQLLLSHALASVTGFPIVFVVEPLVAARTCAVIVLAPVLVVAIPGSLCVRTVPRVSRPS